MNIEVRSSDADVRRARPSFVQERLWLQTQRDLDGASYNLCTAHRIRGPLKSDAFAAAVNAVVSRHESLRMSFVTHDGKPFVEVRERLAVPLELVSVADTSTASISQVVSEIAARPFDLTEPPLARFVLLMIEPDDHILVITLHHTIADGWSIGVMYDDLADHYGAHLQGIHLLDEMPPAPFLSHAERERRRFDEGEFRESIEYWREKLEGAPHEGLPASAARPAIQSFRGDRVRRRLDARTVRDVEAFARSEHCSLFAVLLSLWSGLLSRYGGGEDLVVGTPFANRHDRDSRDVVGSFANTVAIRCDLSGRPTLRALVQRTRECLLADQPHFEAPFDQVVEALDASRSADASVVFQHMLVLLNVPTTTLRLADLEVEELTVESPSCQFDLSLDVKRRGSEMELTLEYATDLYGAEMAEQLLGHFAELIAALVDNADRGLHEISLVDPDFGVHPAKVDNEHARMGHGRLLHDLFEDHAVRTPDAVAVSCGNESLSYRELDERSERFAQRLRDVGVGPEKCVVLTLDRTIELAVAVMGTSKSGGAFVPVDPAWPETRRAHIIKETGAAAVVTHAVGAHDGLEIHLDRPGAAGEQLPAATDRNLAHVFYTSGSTGLPKGVAVEHRSIVNRVVWAVGAYEIGPNDRVMVNSPFTFDPFVWELFAPLMVGARAVITPPGVAEHPQNLARLLRDEQITVAEFVPSLLGRVLRQPETASCASLRAVLCGSEAMPPTLPQQVDAVLDADLYNVYGPTETSIDSTYWRCDADSSGGSVPIGRPIANTTIRVLDEHMLPVPIGVPGEIYIGGVGVARGYVDSPVESASRFVSDPFSEVDGARLFRTGDLGRHRADGALEFIGRIDDQLSLNGVRVEPGEVEHALCSYPGVEQAVVIARSGVEHADVSSTRLVAFVTVSEDVDVSAVRAHVFDRLPRTLVPTAIHRVEVLPLDDNGKVDRRTLAEIDHAKSPGVSRRVEPRTRRENVLKAIWEEVLGTAEFGVTDDFYELGGDSILTLQVLALARDAGIGLSTRDVTRAQTIEELALLGSDVDPSPEGTGRTTGPLAPAQAWFFDQGYAAPHHFNDAVLLRLAPDCDAQRLLRALESVVASHRDLGLVFECQDGEWRQSAGSSRPGIRVRQVDLRGLSSRERDEVRATSSSEAHSCLDPFQGKLASGVLFTADRRRDLLVVLHHLVADAVTWRVLLRELSRAYEEEGLSRSDGQIIDWAHHMASETARGAFDADIEAWSRQRGPSLTRDHDGSNLVADAAVLRGSLDRATTTAMLRGIPAAFDATVVAVLVSALVQTVQQWSSADEVVLAMEAHGRDSVAVPDAQVLDGVGWFTSLYPARFTASGDRSALESLDVVGRELAAIPSRGASYGWLRHHHPDVDVRDRLAAVPEPELLFNYAGQFDHVNRATGTFRQLTYAPGPLQAPEAERSHLIEINSFVLDGRFHHEWTYGANVHDRATIQSLLRHFEARLRELVASIPEAISDRRPSDE